ncbi:Hypothetical protein R9X50_00135400 [Acrodontium crateriforme]|uniref:Uncharacterized protein n=1 Tax=Acrodontium crateriforme TaxID=150365 RepID=A0AAQ3LZL4_9PEZI|nr:Hypothetical protein R9X50_00135400 [Acrodontium crateriforme]
MLLDTMNHLLDFAKINSLTKKCRNESGESATLPIGDGLTKISTTDLGQLVQDVVDGVYLGFSSRQPKQQGFDTHEYATPLSDDPVVLVDIDPTVDWIFDTEPGAWKRILMNLLGNALKYTKQGQVAVTLSINRNTEPQTLRSSISKQICLQVTDTGRGMSADFMKHKLFTPFAQENHLSVGTGLGLSIVHQLVHSLDGSINVQSKPNIGTDIAVMIPIGDKTRASQPKRSLDASTRKPSIDSDTRFKDCKLVVRASFGSSSESAKISAERKLFEDIARGWCGMTVCSQAKDMEESQNGNTFFLTHNRVSQDTSSMGWRICHQFSSAAGKTKSAEIALKHPYAPKRFVMALSEARAAGHDALSKIPLEAGLGITTGENETQSQLQPRLEQSESASSRFSSPLQLRSPRNAEDTTEGEKQLHILLVDDNFINLKVLGTCIDKTGCTYIKATNGKEAVDIHETSVQSFDLIFMDLSMPIMDGYEATRRIRKREEQASIKRARIVALTALGSNDAKRDACHAGVDMFISKPVKMSDIRTLLEAECLRLNAKETLEAVNARLGPQSTITACGWMMESG